MWYEKDEKLRKLLKNLVSNQLEDFEFKKFDIHWTTLYLSIENYIIEISTYLSTTYKNDQRKLQIELKINWNSVYELNIWYEKIITDVSEKILKEKAIELITSYLN